MVKISHKNLIIISLTVLLAVFSLYFYFFKAVFAATNPTNTSQEITDLNNSINQKKKQLDQLKSKQEAYQKAINEKQAQKANLQNQLSIISNRLAEASLSLDQIKIDIETTNLEIQKTNLEIADNDQKVDLSKEHLASAIKLLSQESNKSQLEIILLNNYLTDYINQIKYLQDINGQISENLSELKLAKEDLTKNKESLNSSKEKLTQLQAQLEQQQVSLASEKDTKNYLLAETRSSEAEYQRLLAQAKREQQAASADIYNLEKVVRDKINKQGSGLNTPLTYNGLIWPVPKNTITAYFHDPSYPFRYVFEHPAIDIRAAQGTPIKAAASGYVGRAKDGGMGYSYIMLVHANGLATVYGHVSKIYVKNDEYVTQGQIIGLSGAMPGTPGAGPLTTGPHLHLEVRLNGIPVNPLEYLP